MNITEDDIKSMRNELQKISQDKGYTGTALSLWNVLIETGWFLNVKNKRYGDSVMNGVQVFQRYIKKDNPPGMNAILVRLDDKLNRIISGEELRKNDVVDLFGYLPFLILVNGWGNFSELID